MFTMFTMFKALLPGELHGLSDMALEEELWDRDSFRRFAGFPAAEPVPDHTTLSRFRAARREAGLEAALVEAQAARRRVGSERGPSAPDRGLHPGARQASLQLQGAHQRGPDTQLIAAAELTPANVNETTVADRLLSGRERSAHADRADDAAARARRYAERGIECAIMRRGNRHHPLPERERERERNRRPAALRPTPPGTPQRPRTRRAQGPNLP